MECAKNESDNLLKTDRSVSKTCSLWGGGWTEKKLIAFQKYVNAYLIIMNKCRDKYKWQLVYFDAFAGSGSRSKDKQEENTIQNIFGNSADVEDFSVYKGAAERVLNIQQEGFDFYYFIDKDAISNKKLESKLEPIRNDRKFVFRTNDANRELKKLAEAMHQKKNLAALVLLDPFGMQIDWSSLERLGKTRTDLWILIPTGVIINRLLDRKYHLAHIEKLVSFFGLTEREIRDYFYEEQTNSTLFGDETIIKKVNKPIIKIARLYIARLKTIFKEVTDEPLVMYNTKNVPIYHFAFAGNNKRAKKIAQEIIGKI